MVTLVRLTPQEALTRLARRELNGQLAEHNDACLALLVRGMAPGLADEASDHVVLEWFGELCEAITLVDAVEDGVAHWCEVVPDATGSDMDGQALAAAQSRLDDTLAKLTTPGGAR